MNFVQIFRKVPEDVQWLTLAVSNFYFKRKQYQNHQFPCYATLDFCIGTIQLPIFYFAAKQPIICDPLY